MCTTACNIRFMHCIQLRQSMGCCMLAHLLFYAVRIGAACMIMLRERHLWSFLTFYGSISHVIQAKQSCHSSKAKVGALVLSCPAFHALVQKHGAFAAFSPWEPYLLKHWKHCTSHMLTPTERFACFQWCIQQLQSIQTLFGKQHVLFHRLHVQGTERHLLLAEAACLMPLQLHCNHARCFLWMHRQRCKRSLVCGLAHSSHGFKVSFDQEASNMALQVCIAPVVI